MLADWSAAGGLKVSRKLDDREIQSCWEPHFPEGAVSIGRQVPPERRFLGIHEGGIRQEAQEQELAGG